MPDTTAAVDTRGAPRRWVTNLFYVILALMAMLFIVPFILQIATSFKTEVDSTNNAMSLLPNPFTTEAYVKLFRNSDFPLWTLNSFIVTLFVTCGRLFFDSLAGYALARLRFPGRKALFAILIGVMSVPGVVLLIPKFLVIKQLGIYDTWFGMIIPLLVDAGGVFIMKNFFESIPVAVEEAARIDGAGTFRTFWSVVLPMARPALVTLGILSFQGSWNEFGHFLIASTSPGLTTLTKGVAMLSSGQLSSGNQFPIKLAAATIMTIPVALVFFVFQSRIMNTSAGAVKE